MKPNLTATPPRLYGDCSRLSGDCTGMRGVCTGLYGDLDTCEITDVERQSGIDIRNLNSAPI